MRHPGAAKRRRRVGTVLATTVGVVAAAVVYLSGLTATASPNASRPVQEGQPAGAVRRGPAPAGVAAPNEAPVPTPGRPQTLPLSVGKPLGTAGPAPTPLLPAGGAGAQRAGAPGSQVPEEGELESSNWSGYADLGPNADFTQASARWTVPTTRAGTPGDSATWVGIDGYSNDDLIQAGTDQSDGIYYAWYELIPSYAFSLGNVNAGDKMFVDVVQDVPGTWTITVQDITQKVTWTGPVAYSAARTSAEWIEEAPTLPTNNDSIEALANYGSVEFTDMSVSGPGTSSATGQPIYLLPNGGHKVDSYPGRYDPSTDTLQVTYGSPKTGVVAYPGSAINTTTTTTVTTAPAVGAPPSSSTTTTTMSPPTTVPVAHGYWLVGRDGSVFSFGSASFYGPTSHLALAGPIVGVAATADDKGYWLVASDGGVFAFGDARYQGSVPGLGIRPAGPAGPAASHRLSAPVVGMAPSSDGRGYYVVTSDGAVYTFGDARYRGSCTSTRGCDDPVVAILPDATGNGYWLLLSDADMVAFGDAPEIDDVDCEQTAATSNLVASAAARTADGGGFWVLLDDGTTCPEGDAQTDSIWQSFHITTHKDPAVAIATDASHAGAWLALANGSVDRFGDAPRLSDLNGKKLSSPIIAAAGF